MENNKSCTNCRFSELTEIGNIVECSGCTKSIQEWLDCRKNNYKLWEGEEQ